MSDTPTPRTDAAYFEQGATMYSMAGEMKKLERELAAVAAQRDRLADVLDALSLVVGLTPIAGNKEAIQEANNLARQSLAEMKGPHQ